MAKKEPNNKDIYDMNYDEDYGDRHFEGNARDIEEEAVADRNKRRKSSSLHSRRVKLGD
jgi:hypothetical protein